MATHRIARGPNGLMSEYMDLSLYLKPNPNPDPGPNPNPYSKPTPEPTPNCDLDPRAEALIYSELITISFERTASHSIAGQSNQLMSDFMSI